ncbi:hypothetical protein SBA3_1670003 [Candidatus Sulfopaludibacter sp. SbA3]|nr:hypothetical protein SBA3_1670003 [Candidatus Sulfopaludibacter sp. SbA3]
MTELSQRAVKTIPREAYTEVGEALGIMRNGVLVFETEDVSSVLMDCCLYEWKDNGKSLIQRYVETHPGEPGTDEHYLLNACLPAKFRVLFPESAVPGAGLYCRDILNKEDLFVMDVAFSQSIGDTGPRLATRTIPLGEDWMTNGAALPIANKEFKSALIRSEKALANATWGL